MANFHFSLLSSARKPTSKLLLAASFGLFLFPADSLVAHEEDKHVPAAPAHGNHQHGEMKIDSVGEAWNLIQKFVKEIESALAAKNLAPIHEAEENVSAGLKYLQTNSGMVTRDKAMRLQAALKQALVQSTNVHTASDAKDQVKTETEFKKLQGALKLVAVQYPPDALMAPASMGDMKGMDHGACAHMHDTARAATTNVSLSTAQPLTSGKKADVTIKLSKKDGSPVLLSDLEEAHTQKIHLLIIDSSLSDYHHEHPEPAGTPGEYTFSFTPKKPGPYRVWADLVPTVTGKQEYAIGNISAASKGEPITEKTIKTSPTVGGLKYEITFEDSELKAGQAALGKLKITSADGNPFSQLEPIMGAYAHIVGFNEDFQSIVHIHPMGAEPTKATDRGIGELEFHLLPAKPGLMRLFAQVQIGGKNQFASFTLLIKP